jgi:hypothetical protein
VIVVENNNYQTALLDWAEATNADYWTKVESTTTGANKIDPRIGLPGLQVQFANQGWVVPQDEFARHVAGCECAWCTLDREFRQHPLAPTLDMVMAAWFANQGLNTYTGGSETVVVEKER